MILELKNVCSMCSLFYDFFITAGTPCRIIKKTRQFVILEEADGSQIKYYPAPSSSPAKKKATKAAGKSATRKQSKTSGPQHRLRSCSIVLDNMSKADIDAKIAEIQAKSTDKSVHSTNGSLTKHASASVTASHLNWVDRKDAIQINVTNGYGDNIYVISRSTVHLMTPSLVQSSVNGVADIQTIPQS